jgi:hypothetical protein
VLTLAHSSVLDFSLLRWASPTQNHHPALPSVAANNSQSARTDMTMRFTGHPISRSRMPSASSPCTYSGTISWFLVPGPFYITCAKAFPAASLLLPTPNFQHPPRFLFHPVWSFTVSLTNTERKARIAFKIISLGVLDTVGMSDIICTLLAM